MTDYPARLQIARLKKAVEYIAGTVLNITNTSSVGRVMNSAALRAMTYVSLPYDTVFVFADDNGDVGIFAVDNTAGGSDDGVSLIIDAAGRRWVRQGTPV